MDKDLASILRAETYILDGKTPVAEPDIEKWAEWIQSNNRYVKKSANHEKKVGVSTVFLGLDHGFGKEPVVFETMVFGGSLDGHCERATTWDEAVQRHDRVCEMVAEHDALDECEDDPQ